MRLRPLLIGVLSALAFAGALVAQSSTPGALTLAWDANATTEQVQGYIVERGAVCGAWTTTVDVGNVTTYTFPASLDLTVPSCFAVKAYNAAGQQSPDSTAVQYVPTPPTPPPTDPRFAAPLGDRAVSVFVTDWSATTGQPGSKARINMQLASPNSPITQVTVKLGGTPASVAVGTDLTAFAGTWFTTPTTPGSYPLTVEVANVYGCRATAERPGS